MSYCEPLIHTPPRGQRVKRAVLPKANGCPRRLLRLQARAHAGPFMTRPSRPNRFRPPVIESLDVTKEPSPPKDPFQSLEDLAAFGSKRETARKWIREAACSMGYARSAVSISSVGDVTLRLTVEHRALGRKYEVEFNRRLIEGIADGDVSVRHQASHLIQSIVPRRA